MLKKIKQIFCKHDWAPDILRTKNNTVPNICTKCKKRKEKLSTLTFFKK